MSEPKLQTAKPFVISKAVVFEAYQKVKANDGAAGIDGESIDEFVPIPITPATDYFNSRDS